MSKKTKLLIFALLALIILGWTGWLLFKPKTDDSFNKQEVSIKQTEIPDVSAKKYEDWAGFSFDYPSNLTIKEVELDNPQVYSSLEIYGTDAKKITVRITDTNIANLSDWQKAFIATNAVKKIDQTKLDDLDAVRLQYGAPALIATVALKNGVLYQIESTLDSGFWDRAHADLVESFKFTNTDGQPISSQTNSTTGETIILVEEVVE
jgi:hypothetical protein